MALTRRDFARGVLGGIAATTVAGAEGCGGGGNGGSANGPSDGGTNSCTVYPEQAEGPFYLELDSLRRNIAEDRAGAAMLVQIQVQSAGCSPLRDLAVDLWHCDANGVYSGVSGQFGGLDTTGQTFLRGTQVTDADGVVEFETIYPGWYPGRTTHMHFKVRGAASMEATSQIYFPEDVTSEVYGTAPYDARGQKDTPNGRDGIAIANPVPLAAVIEDGSSGYLATIVVTVA